MPSTVKTRKKSTECAELQADEGIFKQIRERGRRETYQEMNFCAEHLDAVPGR